MARTIPAAAPVRPGGATSAGSTSDMAKTPDTPAPRQRRPQPAPGIGQRQHQQPQNPAQEERGGHQARRPAAMDPVRPARKKQDRRQGSGVEDGEQAGGRGGAGPRLAVDGGEPGDEEVVDDPLGGEKRRADPGLRIPPGRPFGRRRVRCRATRLPTAAGSVRQGRITTVQAMSAIPASTPQRVNGRRQAAGSPIRSRIGPVSDAATIEPLIKPEA